MDQAQHSTPDFQPLSLGEILIETLKLYAVDWWVYIGIVATVQTPLAIFTVTAMVYSGFYAMVVSDPSRLMEVLPGQLPGLVLLLLGLTAINVLLTVSAIFGSVIEAVRERRSGSAPTFASAMFFGWREFSNLLLASLLVGLAAVPLPLLILTVIGIIIAVPALVFLGTKWLFFPQAIVIEKLGARSSLRRSWHLVDGLSWRSLGIGLLLTAITMGLASIPSSVVVLLFVTPSRSVALLLGVALAAGNVAFTILATPIQMIGLTVAYYDLIARKARIPSDI